MSNDGTTNPSSHTAAVRKQSDCNLQGFGIVRETSETTAALTHRPSKRRFSTSDNQNGVAPQSQEAAAPHFVRKQVAAPQPHQTLTRRRSFSSNGAAAAAEQQGGLRSNASSTELAAVVSSRGSSTTTPPRRSASSASVKPRHVNTAERIFPSEGTSFGESETPRRPTSATPRPSNGPTPSKTLAMWATGAVEEGQAATATPRSSRRCYHNNLTHTNAGDQQQSPSAAANLPAEFDLKALTGGRQKAAQVPGASEGPFPRGDEASEASSNNNKNVAGGVHVRPMIRPKDMCRSTGPENELQPVRRLARRCADQHYHNTLHFLDNPRRPSN